MSLRDSLVLINNTKSVELSNQEEIVSVWQEKVKSLFSQIQDWFKPYTDDGLFDVDLGAERLIIEERLGEYMLYNLEFTFGNNRIIFEPIGRDILGAWGRIDFYMTGLKIDKYVLVLLGETFQSAEWFLSSFQDKSKRMKLNKENIENVIEHWIQKYRYNNYE